MPKSLDALVTEARQLEPHITAIQAQMPTSLTDQQIHWLQDLYHTWMAESLAALPQEYGQRFYACFVGQVPGIPSLPGISIQTFIADPAATRENIDVRQVFQRSRQPGPLVWKYPLGTYFLPGYRQQVAILNEARAWMRITPLPVGQDQSQTPGHAFHPKILEAAGRLFEDQHYRQALLAASTSLINAVAEAAGVASLNGAAAMQHVFSKNAPVLRITSHPEEQQGYMQLFAGMVGAVRNTSAHLKPDEPEMDANEALEWLGFLSVLFRVLDRTQKVEPRTGTTST